MENLNIRIQDELEYIVSYPFEEDDAQLSSLVSNWKVQYNISTINTPLSNSIAIDRNIIVALRKL